MIDLQLASAILSLAATCYAIVLFNAVLRKYKQQRKDNLPTDQSFKELLLAALLLILISI
jgi:hypothetical protein